MVIVETTALILAFSPKEKERQADISGFADDCPANPVARMFKDAETLLLLLGEKAGMREVKKQTTFLPAPSSLAAPQNKTARTVKTIRAAENVSVELFLDKLDGTGFLGAAAEGLVENFFAEAKIFRRRFHEFIHVNVFQRAFQREFHRRREMDAFAVAL